MEAEPFVQLVFDHETNGLVDGVTQATEARQWQVTSDAARKVVIRDHQAKVIGVGRWGADATEERKRSSRVRKKLDERRWNAIDKLLHARLQELRGAPANPEQLDSGELAADEVEFIVPKLKLPPGARSSSKSKSRGSQEKKGTQQGKKTGKKKKKGKSWSTEKKVRAIVLALFLVGFTIFTVRFFLSSRYLPRGAKCTFDIECLSKSCRDHACM